LVHAKPQREKRQERKGGIQNYLSAVFSLRLCVKPLLLMQPSPTPIGEADFSLCSFKQAIGILETGLWWQEREGNSRFPFNFTFLSFICMITIPKLKHADSGQFFLMAGPCAIEGEDMAFEIAGRILEITSKLNIPYIFKGSYRKANRSRMDSFTGIGDEKALSILEKIGGHFAIPTVTDIHESDEAAVAAEHVDVLQIPAFLCRQTELLVAAARTGKVVNIKKGQFLSGEAMRFAVDKVRESGNDNIILTDRGNTFGYGDLVVDFRNIPAMQTNQVPVVMDVTHSLQQPNQASGVTGGKPALISTMARAAIAAGADGLFIETHPQPLTAKSDGANMLPLDQLEPLLEKLTRIREVVREG
jgi:2-dehydro-3-deoxyphosphooctonate aldolase (KDO 8-P synthase)